jgi:DNA-binding NarL/FixJ family response regulator
MRVVVVDDSSLIREGLVRLLAEAGFDVVGQFSDGASFEAAIGDLEPDVAIFDVRLPPTFTDEGAQLAARLRESRPGIPVLLLSQRIETRTALRLAREHAQGFGYLLKDRVIDLDQFFDDVRRIAGGGTAIDPEVVSQLLRRQAHRDAISALTPREREVLTLVAAGQSNAGICSALSLTVRTVETHLTSIFEKLGLEVSPEENRRVLAVLAFLGGPDSGKTTRRTP